MTGEYFDQLQETDPDFLIQKFFEYFNQYSKEDEKRIRSAWKFLVEKSQGHTRSNNKVYYLHPIRVSAILAKSNFDCDSIIGGFFHDILSLDNVTSREIGDNFGQQIISIVEGIARTKQISTSTKTLADADSIRKMLFAMVDDIRIILIKLADRLDRMRNLKDYDEETQHLVSQEALDIWAPLANRLGMSQEKNELEDLSLKYINPQAFQQIKAIVASKKDERDQILSKAVEQIQSRAAKAGIQVSIKARAKHFYSIYQKMRKRNKEAGELFDLLAIRLICNTNEECYTLIGIVHILWTPLDGRFKDYIAMPKSNGYQSIHTTVIMDGRPLEVQIRTTAMHNIAEHGVASHWLYKKGTNHDLIDVSSLSIFNQLRELSQNHLTDENFFAEFKNDLLKDKIVVFTPKGQVVQLPVGATAIDFAYHIHSKIGETIVGAKADGKIIPLSTPLKNTQIIEIITNPQAHPGANQLEHVVTAKARQKINAWLYANDKAFEELGNERHLEAQANEASTAIQKKKRPKKGPAGEIPHVEKIRIGDTSNFMMNIAQCCKPKFPDPITAYVSRTRGLVIHKPDCLVYLNIPNVEKRSVDVIWDWDEKDKN
ncbi:MAG: RelA/SpoT family protein [Treponema sp.]|nr:RelA/SpoT family protein [Treponema sp.]